MLQIAGTVVLDAMAQCQVLCPCRGTDRVGLDEAEPSNGLRQGGGVEERARYRVATQVIESRFGHAADCSTTARVTQPPDAAECRCPAFRRRCASTSRAPRRSRPH